jgi:hypothetical protein
MQSPAQYPFKEKGMRSTPIRNLTDRSCCFPMETPPIHMQQEAPKRPPLKYTVWMPIVPLPDPDEPNILSPSLVKSRLATSRLFRGQILKFILQLSLILRKRIPVTKTLGSRY